MVKNWGLEKRARDRERAGVVVRGIWKREERDRELGLWSRGSRRRAERLVKGSYWVWRTGTIGIGM